MPIAALAAVLLAAIGCTRNDSAPPSPSAAPARGGELVASTRSEPATYNRFAPNGAHAAIELVTSLTQARLVRVNRITDELEPWLAEKWSLGGDGVSYTVTLRDGVVFSDGHPLSSADVLFSFRAAYDPSVASALDSALRIAGKPLEVTAPDARTVVIKFPAPFAPGLRLVENLPILPKHKLEATLAGGTFAAAWSPGAPLTDIVGLGPFVLAEHVAGQRLVFTRNPHYFRRDANGVQLPYLDKLTLAVVADQNTEALRLEASEIDLMANADIRPQDHAAFKRLTEQGRLKMYDVGVGLDPDFLAFNLRADRGGKGNAPWSRREFRQAISCAVDRQAIVNAVYLGAAVPIYSPVSPDNKRWFSAAAPPCTFDRERARTALSQIGFADRNGDGTLEDASGKAVRFSIMTQAGHLRERVSSVLQEQLRQLGIAVDIVALDPGGLFKRWSAGDYDATYFGLQASSRDPALNPDFWLSSGPFHFWNPGQSQPATPWEARIDTLMHEHAVASDLSARQRAFAEVQRILVEELPSIYFVAPRVTVATSPKVAGAAPALQIPHLLWNADSLAVAR
ncbi:MAG TPA: ABC transporter substrate-binding protein [Vicinamibacterales bacterium]|nr:ABC transporter substrate-binding protein [Vicinamibacterales bacterium]